MGCRRYQDKEVVAKFYSRENILLTTSPRASIICGRSRKKGERMKNKKLVAIVLLSLSFCFVSGVGYGKIPEWIEEENESYMNWLLLHIRVNYIMYRPNIFLDVGLFYDVDGRYASMMEFPKNVVTERKIIIGVRDNREVFSGKFGKALLGEFEKALKDIYYDVEMIASDMKNDIVAKFYSKGDFSLGYFYQGEYHLWEE